MPLKDWRAHWRAVNTSGPATLDTALRQVGKTLLGKPVDPGQVEMLCAHIAARLELSPTDRVVDCGCGNGLLTSRLAGLVAEVLGVDCSAPLLEIATVRFGRENIRYALADLAALDEAVVAPHHYHKAWSCEVLQHLAPDEAQRFLDHLGRALVPGYRILVCGIPDRARLRAFYNTPERWDLYCRNIRHGGDQIGFWWEREELSQLAAAAGMRMTLVAQPPALYTAHYRFDALLEAR